MYTQKLLCYVDRTAACSIKRYTGADVTRFFRFSVNFYVSVCWNRLLVFCTTYSEHSKFLPAIILGCKIKHFDLLRSQIFRYLARPWHNFTCYYTITVMYKVNINCMTKPSHISMGYCIQPIKILKLHKLLQKVS